MLALIARKLRDALSEPEDKLVDKIELGNLSAFGKLYMKYLDGIYRYVYFRVNRDRMLAEDLTSSVFAKALDKIDLFKSERGSFRSWIYGITRNTITDYYRKNGNAQLTTGNGLSESIESTTPESLLDASEKQQEIAASLSKITSLQQEAIILRFVEQMPNKEVAIVLNRTPQATRALVYRAVKQLRVELKDI